MIGANFCIYFYRQETSGQSAVKVPLNGMAPSCNERLDSAITWLDEMSVFN